MKTIRGRLPLKVTALVLFLLCGLMGLLGGVAAFYMAEAGYYTAPPMKSFYETDSCARLAYSDAALIGEYLLPELLGQKTSQDEEMNAHIYVGNDANFRYEIYDAEEKRVFGNYEDQAFGYETSYAVTVDGEDYLVAGYVLDPINGGDSYYSSAFVFDHFYQHRVTVIVVAVLALLLAVACLVFLFCAAGYRRGKEGIHFNMLDRLPLDLYALIVLGLSMFILSSAESNSYNDNLVYGVVFIMTLLLGCLLCLAFLLSLATRLKVGGWWRNTIIYYFFRWLGRGGRKLGRFISAIVGHLPLLWKVILACVIYFGVNLILVAILVSTRYYSGFGVFLAVLVALVFNLVVLLVLCYVVLQLIELKKGAEALAAGNFHYHVDTSKMRWEIAQHGENLNSTAVGMEKALAKAMQSERLKTELITNVSHDLKTPLTSLINYVDLLKKEDIGTAEAREYVEVLERQSARLKKLTEDLVEASKAATGNIAVSAMRTDIVELLNQSLGEYAERFTAANLTVVREVPDHAVVITIDGRLLWRVFDNLLNNICKYAQPQTRVYCNLENGGEAVVITLRNISKEPLNISTDELMQRFVRGDSARSTEGSGLGLSIARSLTELQGGQFRLDVDGDLFKVTLRFPCQ